MSESAYSGYTFSKTIGSSSAAAESPVRSSPSITALRKRHSTTGWMAVKRSLIAVWMRALNSSMLRRTAIANSGNTSCSAGRCEESKSPRCGEPSSRVPITRSW